MIDYYLDKPIEGERIYWKKRNGESGTGIFTHTFFEDGKYKTGIYNALDNSFITNVDFWCPLNYN